MTNVYAWPPVGIMGHEWTEIAPVSVSESLLTDRVYESSYGRKRRMAVLEVSALSAGQMGAGYMEVLKRLLDGGVNRVRLYSYPINRYLDVKASQSFRQSERVVWTDGGAPVVWTDGGAPVVWFSGAVLAGTPGTSGGFPSISVSGLPPNTLVARPGEFLTVYQTLLAGSAATTIMVMAPATSNGSGVAVIRLMATAPYGTRVNLGVRDTGVFRAMALPRATQPLLGNWTYSWEFSEVFEDETAGGFTEVDPWS